MLDLLVSALEMEYNFLPTESSPKHTNHDGNLCFFTLVSQNDQNTKRRPFFIENQWCCRAALPEGWEVQDSFPSHTTEMHLCWKTLACFLPSLQTASTCCHPRGKANLTVCSHIPHQLACNINPAYVTSWQWIPTSQDCTKIKPILSQHRHMESWFDDSYKSSSRNTSSFAEGRCGGVHGHSR